MNDIIYWKNPTNNRVLKLRRKVSTFERPACKGCYFDNESNIESEVCDPKTFVVNKYPDCMGNDFVFELVEVLKYNKNFEENPILFQMHTIQDSKPKKGQDVLIYTNKSGFNIASLDGRNWRRKPSAKSHLCVSYSDRWIELEKLNVIDH